MSAMKRLDGKTMHWNVANSSVQKGESFEGIIIKKKKQTYLHNIYY